MHPPQSFTTPACQFWLLCRMLPLDDNHLYVELAEIVFQAPQQSKTSQIIAELKSAITGIPHYAVAEAQ